MVFVLYSFNLFHRALWLVTLGLVVRTVYLERDAKRSPVVGDAHVTGQNLSVK